MQLHQLLAAIVAAGRGEKKHQHDLSGAQSTDTRAHVRAAVGGKAHGVTLQAVWPSTRSTELPLGEHSPALPGLLSAALCSLPAQPCSEPTALDPAPGEGCGSGRGRAPPSFTLPTFTTDVSSPRANTPCPPPPLPLRP